jgi:hypothetical protein
MNCKARRDCPVACAAGCACAARRRHTPPLRCVVTASRSFLLMRVQNSAPAISEIRYVHL